MAAKKGENQFTEVDKLTSVENSALTKATKHRSAIASAMTDKDMQKKVMDFIFSGDPEAVSPLDEVRKGLK